MARLALRTKLALVATGVTLLGTAVGLALTYVALVNVRVAALDNESRLLANVILEAAASRNEGVLRMPRVVESYLTDLSGVSVAHVYQDGALTWEGGAVDAPRPLDPDRLLVGTGARSADEWRVFTTRDEEAGLVVQVAQPLQGVRSVLGPYFEIALGAMFLVAVLAGGLAWASVGAALRPLRRLSAAVERSEAGQAMPHIPGRDEPARLARAFADLVERLRRERDRELAFLAYASHELRTPVTALRAGLGTLQAGRVDPTPERLQRLHREASRLEVLAQNLLVLSRAASRDVHPAPLAVDELVSDAFDRFAPLAAERGLRLELDAGTATVRADARLLTQALDNLLDNAFRATRSGTITLRSGADGDRAFLEVEDTGRGLPEAPREGLGLRVVRNVARAHEGRFEIATSDVTRARLWLPAGKGGAT